MQIVTRAARRLLIGAALLYCIAVIALGLLWTLQADRTWWLALSNVFALYLFAPLPVLAPAALLLRSRWLRAGASLTLAAFLALFGARLIPRLGQPAEGTRLRIMTINQMYINKHIAGLATAIRAQDADIVAIQELSEPLAETARQQLRAQYPYQFLEPNDGFEGLGVLSRYPLREARHARGFPGQQMIVDLGGEQVTLFNIHLNSPKIETRRLRQFRPVKLVLDYDTSSRAREFPQLLAAIDATRGPLIALGDFNTSDREPPYAALAARLHDAYRETSWGFGFTFPNDQRLARVRVPFPLVRIDYIWSRGGVLPANARVECDSGGSDHCAVIAELRIGTAEASKGGDAPW